MRLPSLPISPRVQYSPSTLCVDADHSVHHRLAEQIVFDMFYCFAGHPGFGFYQSRNLDSHITAHQMSVL